MKIKRKIKPFVSLLIPLLIITAISGFLQITVVQHPERVALWLSSVGPFLVIGYVIIQTAAIIIPPIPGSVVSLPLLAILGPVKGLLLIYLVVTPVECINFWLAKKYGRDIVKKMLGQSAMEKVDKYTKNTGLGTAMILKLFEDNYFDYISYGLGLTSVTLRQFILINFLVGLPRVALSYVILTRAPNFTSAIVIIEILAAVLTGGYILFRHLRHRKEDLEQIDNFSEIE